MTKINNITFSFLPNEGSVKIYSSAGELVKTMNFSNPVDGKLTWDVTNEQGEDLASDVYVYIVKSGDNKKSGKVMVIR